MSVGASAPTTQAEQLAPVVEAHAQVDHAAHDVLVGDDVAVLVDDEPGADRGLAALAVGFAGPASLGISPRTCTTAARARSASSANDEVARWRGALVHSGPSRFALRSPSSAASSPRTSNFRSARAGAGALAPTQAAQTATQATRRIALAYAKREDLAPTSIRESDASRVR